MTRLLLCPLRETVLPPPLRSDAKNAASDKISDGLTSPVRAQVDAALGKASAELKTKMASVEEELRAKASKLDEDFNRKQAELQAQFDAKRAEVEASVEARVGPMKAKLTAEFEAKRQELEASVEARVAPLKAKLTAEFEAKKNELRDRALHEFELILVKTLDEKVLPAIQKAALDPLMPLVVQEIVVEAIAASWPDIKEEIFDLWSGLVLKFAPVDDPPFISYWPNPLRAAMNSWLYHTYPYDRNFWWQIRRPMWWFWNVVALCPFYGVQALYFILLFLMLDKRDEFQMVNFILQFKGLQFVTLGVLNCMVGSASYYGCVGVDYASGDLGLGFQNDLIAGGKRLYLHDCDTQGPGGLPGFYTDMVLFLIQSATIWAAMAILPRTVKKGVKQLAPDSPPRHFEGAQVLARVAVSREGVPVPLTGAGPVYNGMGGKLRPMILFDALMLLIVCGVTVILLFTRPYSVTTSGAFSKREWLFREDVFWLKTLYGLSSFPFVVFLLPVISGILLHTRPTGYNRQGVCVPLEPKTSDAVPLVLQPGKGRTGIRDLNEPLPEGAVRVVTTSNPNALAQYPQPQPQLNQVAQAPPGGGRPVVSNAWADNNAQGGQVVVLVHPNQPMQ